MWSRFIYPKTILDLARRRVQGLLRVHILQTESIDRLLQSAYLQGMIDAIESLEKT